MLGDPVIVSVVVVSVVVVSVVVKLVVVVVVGDSDSTVTWTASVALCQTISETFSVYIYANC